MTEEEKKSGWDSFKQWIPLIAVAIIVLLIYFFGFHKYLSFENLKLYHETLRAHAKEHPFLTVLIYMGAYFLGTALLLPEMSILTLLGGLLFPFPISGLYTVVAATLGACVIFFIAETAVGKYIAERASNYLRKLQKGFQEDARSYLLFLRLVPLFPFWLVNIAPAIFNVRLWTYAWTTFVGIIPGTLVLCYAGHSLNSIFENNEAFSIRAFLTPQIIISFVALGIIILIPVLVKYIKRRKNKPND